MKNYLPKILGNRGLCARLGSDAENRKLSHAYILEGRDGSGRKTIALMTAAAVACERRDEADAPLPCLECRSCKKILECKSPDVIFVTDEGKSSVGIAAARFLKEDVYTVPNDLDDKFYIIENADKLTEPAQNALLLTLEEPPSFVHFFLICNDSANLLETIRSRAPTLRTEPVEDSKLAEYICCADKRAAQLRLSSPREFDELITVANGGIGQALSLLDEKQWKSERERRALCSSLLDAAILKKGRREIIPIIHKLSKLKRDALSDYLTLISSAIRDLILLKKSDTPTLCFYPDRNAAIELSDRASLSFLYDLYENVKCAIDENARNANVYLLLVKMALNSKII